MTTQYLLAIDQGTSSSRTVIYDERANVITSAQQEFRQIYPEPGWVEHDPEEIWETVSWSIDQALEKAGLAATDIAAIGITNQRETTVLWDRDTLTPVYNAIVWQCRRSAAICDQLKDQGMEETFQEKTGLLLDAYFSGSKVRWLLKEVPGLQTRAEAGETSSSASEASPAAAAPSCREIR